MKKETQAVVTHLLRFFDVERDFHLGETIVDFIDEETVQSFAEANFGRTLTDTELNRFRYALWFPEAFDELMTAVHTALVSVLDTSDEKWALTDHQFRGR